MANKQYTIIPVMLQYIRFESVQTPSILCRSLGSWLKTEEEKVNSRGGWGVRLIVFSSWGTPFSREAGRIPSREFWRIGK